MNVAIYVRLPPDRDRSRRVVSFALPANVPQDAVLMLGGAIDGGQAVFEIENPLRNQALLKLERNIVILLKTHEHEVSFK